MEMLTEGGIWRSRKGENGRENYTLFCHNGGIKFLGVSF